jgi:hypothetical protein
LVNLLERLSQQESGLLQEQQKLLSEQQAVLRLLVPVHDIPGESNRDNSRATGVDYRDDLGGGGQSLAVR